MHSVQKLDGSPRPERKFRKTDGMFS